LDIEVEIKIHVEQNKETMVIQKVSPLIIAKESGFRICE